MSETSQPPPEEPPEETDVEIHKLKPIHSWRDFLKELGTIVLGICIAIGLEQLVENWHWAGEVKEARRALVAEIAANNSNLFVMRLAIAPCIDRRLDEADRIISALEAKQKPNPFTDYRLPTGFLLNDSEWQSERASQVLTHFSRDELAVFSRYYAQLPSFADWMNKEEAAWAKLNILRKPPAEITASDLIQLKDNLFMAQRVAGLIQTNSLRELSISKELGIPEVKPYAVLVKNFCGAMSWEDYQRWRRMDRIKRYTGGND
jgi:hypothetical protein